MSSDTPTPEPVPAARFRQCLRLIQAVCEAAVIGLAIGAWDANSTNSQSGTLYFIAGIVLGWRHLGVAWFAWLPLGSGLYIAHRVAIAYGYKQPFVEPDALAARVCMEALYDAGIALGIGSMARIVLEAIFTRLRRKGKRRQFWPATILGLMLLVAKVASSFAIVHWVTFDFQTIYAPNFSEGRFGQIRVGMPAAEVEKLLGRPLYEPVWQNGKGTWIYSRGVSDTANYCRRWVFFDDGKVSHVVSDDWLD